MRAVTVVKRQRSLQVSLRASVLALRGREWRVGRGVANAYPHDPEMA